MEAGRQIMLIAQKSAGKDEPKADDMFEIGCVSSILQMLKLPRLNQITLRSKLIYNVIKSCSSKILFHRQNMIHGRLSLIVPKLNMRKLIINCPIAKIKLNILL